MSASVAHKTNVSCRSYSINLTIVRRALLNEGGAIGALVALNILKKLFKGIVKT